VQPDDGAPHGRHAGGDLLQLGARNLLSHARIEERLAQLAHQPRLVLAGEKLHVDAEGGIELQEHGNCQRALVVLDLVEIAQRNTDGVGQRLLGEPALFPQPLQSHTHKQLFHGVTLASQTSQTLQIH
jgi:hypothetical protein